VNILLRYGADPTIKNDLGKSPVDYCDALPELRGALKRVIHMQDRFTKHTVVTLHRRNSTATNMKFPMYLAHRVSFTDFTEEKILVTNVSKHIKNSNKEESL
jgi:hypothetical protein